MKWHREDVKLNSPHEAVPLVVVGDGMYGTSRVGDGRLIPVIIVEATGRDDIKQLVAAHTSEGPPGDVVSNWIRFSWLRDDELGMLLKFKQPVRVTVVIRFDLPKHAALIDQVIRVQGFYLQPGKPGDRLSNKVNADRILVEVPSKDFAAQWEPIFTKVTVKRLRRRGLSRSVAKQKAREMIKNWRELGSQRLRDDFNVSENDERSR
jgi:hypothetical protein